MSAHDASLSLGGQNFLFFGVASVISSLQTASEATSCTVAWGWSISNGLICSITKRCRWGFHYLENMTHICFDATLQSKCVLLVPLSSKEVPVLYQDPTWNQMYSCIWSWTFSFCSRRCREYGNFYAPYQACKREHSLSRAYSSLVYDPWQ